VPAKKNGLPFSWNVESLAVTKPLGTDLEDTKEVARTTNAARRLNIIVEIESEWI